MQVCSATTGQDRLEPGPECQVCRDSLFEESALKGPQIETRAAHQQSIPVACLYSGDLLRGESGKVACSKVLGRLYYIYKMVRNTLHLGFVQLSSGDIESAIDLNRIEVDYLAAQPQSEGQAESALARGGRANNS